MTEDPRTMPIRAGRASRSLEGLIAADEYLAVNAMVACAPSAPVRNAPDAGAEQVDQLLFGETFDALEVADGFIWGQCRRDGYVGFVEAAALTAPNAAPTARIAAIRTYAFARPDFKAPACGPFPMNSLVAIEAREARFVRVAGAGWIFEEHLAPIGWFETDPVAVAERFVGAPYLWGGRDGLGVDCSGLVQQAMFACGRACPRDADQQAALGHAIGAQDLRRGDLVVWPGHVALMVDAARIVHADSHHMHVVVEDLAAAVDRRSGAEMGGPVAFRRLDLPVSTGP